MGGRWERGGRERGERGARERGGEQRLRGFENKYLERYLELGETKLPVIAVSYIILSYLHCILHLT